MKRSAIVFLGLLAACSAGSDKPYATDVGVLEPGATITIKAKATDVNVYKPKVGEPADRYTVSSTALAGAATPPPVPSRKPAGNGVVVLAPDPLRSLLVRAPDRVNVSVDVERGNVAITDISGTTMAHTGDGSINVMVAGYAQATAQHGNVNVTMGSLDWPGTLKIATGLGDVVVYVNENAKFRVRMHTDNGILFSDFPGLRGTSTGKTETIEAPVNGGGPRVLDLESGGGEVRLLMLTPQA